MSAGTAAHAGRMAAERLMTLTLSAASPALTETTDADGMTTVDRTTEDPTPGKVAGSTGTDPITRTVTVGGVERPVLQGGLHIPLSAQVPEFGWMYVVTALGAYDDPALLGRKYLVISVPAKSYATARRLDVVEVP